VSDRIITSGKVTGVPAGAKLTPFIKVGGARGFERGKATIVVQSDGTFRWTRKIAKGKAVTAYVGFAAAKSNQVTWVRIG
jgi:hypothetical protein